MRDALRGKSPRRILSSAACICSRSASGRSGTNVGVSGRVVVLAVKASFVEPVGPYGDEDAACGGEVAVVAVVKLGSCSTPGVSICVRGRS